MNRFAELLDRLAYEPGRNNKLRLITAYFRDTPDPDRGYALAALTGALSFKHAKPGLIRGLIEARADPTLCVSCHSPASCIDCHRARGLLSAGPMRASPHPAGWVSTPSGPNLHGHEARRDPLACASCHGGAGERLCVGCHRVGGPGGNPHPPRFDSTQARRDMPCRMCHEGER